MSSWTHCSQYLALRLEKASLKGQLVWQRQSGFGLSAEGLFSVIFKTKKLYWGMGENYKGKF